MKGNTVKVIAALVAIYALWQIGGFAFGLIGGIVGAVMSAAGFIAVGAGGYYVGKLNGRREQKQLMGGA